MIQSMNMEHAGFTELAMQDLQETNGGLTIPSWLKGTGILTAVAILNENWDDIKKGLKDGWNFDKK